MAVTRITFGPAEESILVEYDDGTSDLYVLEKRPETKPMPTAVQQYLDEVEVAVENIKATFPDAQVLS